MSKTSVVEAVSMPLLTTELFIQFMFKLKLNEAIINSFENELIQASKQRRNSNISMYFDSNA